jgi:preprotein translocase subunit SecG
MQTVLIVIHLLIVIFLVGFVLLQRSEGGGLGLGGGSSGVSGFMTGRGQANVLTRTTMYLAIGFFLTSMVLAWLAGSTRKPTSIFDSSGPSQSAPGDGQGNLLERLQRGQGSQPAGPSGPSEPQVPTQQ